MLKPNLAIQTAVASAAHRAAWGAAVSGLLGSSILFICKRTPVANAPDPWATGTEFLRIGMQGPLFADPENGTLTLGKINGTLTRAAADLGTGTSVFRIQSGSYVLEGSLGLAGSGADLTMTASPTTSSGFTITGAKLSAPPTLPVNGNSVDVGGTLTNVSFQNTTGAPTVEELHKFAYVFKKGAMPATGAAITLSGPTTIPAQLNVTNTHSDGSVRHAVIAAVVPAIAANTTASYNIVRANSSAATPTVPADFAGLDAIISVVNDGVTYTASLATLLAAGYTTRLSGNVVSEWHTKGALKTAGNVAHESLTARFHVSAYKGKGKAMISMAVENGTVTIGGTTGIKHKIYDLTMSVGGTQVYTKAGVQHLPFQRFRKVFWYGGAAPTLHIRHNSAYIIATKATPNYDPTIINATNTTTETNFVNNQATKNDILQPGVALPYMPTTGGRADIGILTGWDSLYLLGMNKSMRDVCLKQADLMGSWGTHWRDSATDQPVSAIDSPNITVNPNFSYSVTAITAANPAVVTHAGHKMVPGMSVYFLNVAGTMGSVLNFSNVVVGACTADTFELVGKNTTGLTYTGSGTFTAYNTNQWDTAHMPETGYLAYLLTGDYYYLEEAQFFAIPHAMGQYLHGRQTRSQAWGLRDIAHVAYMSPDSDRLKSHYSQLLAMNLTDYNTRYSTGSSANSLGAIIGGSAWSDPDSTGNNTRSWQDDFVTQALGHILELGFAEAAWFFNFKAKYPVSRMNYCRMLSCSYNFKLRTSNTAPVFSTIEQVFAATFPPGTPQAGNDLLAQVFESAAMAAQAGALGGETVVANSMIGYADSAQGYGADMQPALAFAATHGATGAAAAWAKYDARAVKQAYSGEPQFAIVPRI